ncbi:hypothetical protein RUM43_003931 [Polyplax serrata]|uniref:Uncharacterized protein n=1 Tax=Polyplax serrata TaxID=468196 RepID=A0AAN8PFM1_POLSC
MGVVGVMPRYRQKKNMDVSGKRVEGHPGRSGALIVQNSAQEDCSAGRVRVCDLPKVLTVGSFRRRDMVLLPSAEWDCIRLRETIVIDRDLEEGHGRPESSVFLEYPNKY